MAERIFTINLRKATLEARRWEKSKKSVAVVRNFLKKHMKTDEIKIGKSITEKIWSGGNQNPPSKIRIRAIETEEGEDKIKMVRAELIDVYTKEDIKETSEKKEEVKNKPENKETKK